MALRRRSRTSVAQRASERGVLAAVVAARRQELDLTQTELADLAGVARGPVVSVEAGRAISFDVLLSLLHVLGLHLELARGAGSAGVEANAALALQYGLADGTRHADGGEGE